VEKIKILGIAGSLRKNSYNRALLRAAVELAPPDAEIEIFDISEIPPFNQDFEADPPAIVAEFKNKIRTADAILFVTPEYNYSIPGVLKNAIDWASRPSGDSAWKGKPAAIMGASMGNIATARAQYDLRKIMVSLDMHTLNKPEIMVGNAHEKFDEAGRLTDETTRGLVKKQLEALVQWTRHFKQAKEKGAVN
jgi:chromate reductase